MRKILLILCFIGIGFTSSKAQKTKISWGQKAGLTISDAAPDFEILGSIDGYYYTLIKHYANAASKKVNIITRITLLKFDASHNQLFSKDIIPESGSGFLKAFTYSDHFQFFYQGLDEKKRTALYVQDIGLEGNELSVPQLIDSRSPQKAGFESYHIEQFDGDKFLVSYNYQFDVKSASYLLNSKSSIIVFSRLFQKVYEAELGDITKDSKVIHSQLFGADNGNLVLLNTAAGKAKAEYQHQLAEWNYETKEYRKIALGIKEKSVKFSENENQFIAVALTARANNEASVNLIFQSVDRESFKTDEAVEIDLNQNSVGEYIAINEEFESEKSKEIKPYKKFNFNKISLKKNGNFVLRIEESIDYGTKFISNSGNIILVSIDNWGKLKWAKMVQRANQVPESNPELAAALEFEIGDVSYFIYNDHAENTKADGFSAGFQAKPVNISKPQTAVVSWVGIDANGKFSKGLIEDISNMERSLYFNPQISKMNRDGNGVIMLMGVDKTKLSYKLGTIKFSIQ
ncbi:MAG: hypothetical protein ACOVP1_08200 [Bacteroidia bacterium]